jgi:CRP-like cAMP-binding protein
MPANHALIDRLRRLPWLSRSQLNQVTNSARVLEIRRAQTVYREHDRAAAIYVILSGQAILAMVEPRRRAVITVVGPGDIVGISALFSPGQRHFRCETLSECKVAAVDPEVFREVLLSEPRNFEQALRAVFTRWEALLRRYALFMSLNARGRIAVTLLELAERFGVTDQRGRLLPFALSHAMLGEMVGASRQHVTMQLVDFEREKSVLREHRRIVVVPDKLRQALA